MTSFSIAAPCPNSPCAIRLAAALVGAWLVAMAALLWHFEQQRIAGSRQLLHFDVRDLPGPPAGAPAGMARVLYFVDSRCPCSAAALAEIALARRETTAPLARFVFAESAAAGLDARPLSAAERLRWQSHVPATPAVAVWDERDKLIYFGPVNVNAGCGSELGYLRMALQSLSRQQGFAAGFQSWDVVACTCPGAAAQSTHS
jgi:hypothetical protein